MKTGLFFFAALPNKNAVWDKCRTGWYAKSTFGANNTNENTTQDAHSWNDKLTQLCAKSNCQFYFWLRACFTCYCNVCILIGKQNIIPQGISRNVVGWEELCCSSLFLPPSLPAPFYPSAGGPYPNQGAKFTRGIPQPTIQPNHQIRFDTKNTPG